MGELFTPTHLMVLAVVVLVLFGGKKLPELGKGRGEGLKGFKDGMKGVAEEANKPGGDRAYRDSEGRRDHRQVSRQERFRRAAADAAAVAV